jgi:hypothetical protein
MWMFFRPFSSLSSAPDFIHSGGGGDARFSRDRHGAVAQGVLRTWFARPFLTSWPTPRHGRPISVGLPLLNPLAPVPSVTFCGFASTGREVKDPRPSGGGFKVTNLETQKLLCLGSLI